MIPRKRVTLGDLQDAFYYFKNESGDRFSDDDLIEFMEKVFNGQAGRQHAGMKRSSICGIIWSTTIICILRIKDRMICSTPY